MRVAGIGFREAATPQALHDALDQAVGNGPPVEAVATEQGKSRTSVFRDFAADLNVPALGISTKDLAQMTTLTQSDRVRARMGTGSLAEAAALAAAGPNATLAHARVVSRDCMATAAIADSKGTQT